MSQRKPRGRTQIYGSPESDPEEGTRIAGTFQEDSSPRASADSPDRPLQPDEAPAASTNGLGLAGYVREEIARAIEGELGRRGHPGAVRIEADTVHLRHGEVTLTSPLGTWARFWPRMDDSARKKNVVALARALSQSRSLRPIEAPRMPIFVDPRLAALTVVLVLAGLYYVFVSRKYEAPEAASRSDNASREGQSPHSSVLSSVVDSEKRAERVCAKTMARVFRGGSVTIADVEGWSVHIALMGAKGEKSKWQPEALRNYLEDPSAKEGSRFIWTEEPGLASLDTSDTRVKVQDIDLGGRPGSRWALVLSFGGTLVDPYFQEEARNKYFHIAHSLSDDLEADLGAVYASCQGSPTHALGSWFRGADAAGAATSLMYFMGMYASPLHISKTQFGAVDKAGETVHGGALLSISQNAGSVDREVLSGVVGNEGGMALGAADSHVTITFPFRDGNRASRASRSLARLTGLSP